MMTTAFNPTSASDAELIPASDDTLITATPVEDEDRPDFWPRHFRGIPQWILLEPRIFAWTDRLCADYSGGIWQFYTLSNGSPGGGGGWILSHSLNAAGFKTVMTP